MTARVGLGVDFHRLAPGRPLVLGGVRIPHSTGLAGHSDADVLLHAIGDSLLGAAGQGDIGTQFPDIDPATLGISSLALLAQITARIAGAGWGVVNVDCVVIAEEPRLVPFFVQMQSAISSALRISPDRVGLKATTSEQMGALGRREGMAALAVSLIERA